MRIAYDLVGSRETGAVAIVEPVEGVSPEKLAEEIMRRHPHVKSVLLKAGERSGEFRVRPLKLIAGSEHTEVIHKEYGLRFKLDPRVVYFSPREAEERRRVATQVADGEMVYVMFAGVGPYALVIASMREATVVGVELNPHAAKYFGENVRLNKLGAKVFPLEGDVSFVSPALYGKFDRVIMPLPKGAYLFLRHALRSLKPDGGYLHFYYWGGDDAFQRGKELVSREALTLGLQAIYLGGRKVSSYAPRVWKVRLDFKILSLSIK